MAGGHQAVVGRDHGLRAHAQLRRQLAYRHQPRPGRQLAGGDQFAQARLDLVGQGQGGVAVEGEHERSLEQQLERQQQQAACHQQIEEPALARIGQQTPDRHAEQGPQRAAGETDHRAHPGHQQRAQRRGQVGGHEDRGQGDGLDPGLGIDRLEHRRLRKAHGPRHRGLAHGAAAGQPPGQEEQVERAGHAQQLVQQRIGHEQAAQAQTGQPGLGRNAEVDAQDLRHGTAVAEVRARGGQHHIVGTRRARHHEAVGHQGQQFGHRQGSGTGAPSLGMRDLPAKIQMPAPAPALYRSAQRYSLGPEQAAQHQLRDQGLGRGIVASLQGWLAQQDGELRRQIGIGLGAGPDGEHQVAVVELPDALLARPALEGLHIGIECW
eukprot:Opistho-1_new@51810